MNDKLDLIKHLEDLVAIALDEQERQKYAIQWESILGCIDLITRADTGAIQVQPQTVEFKALREDIPEPSLPRAELLSNASITQEDSFVTPKVVG